MAKILVADDSGTDRALIRNALRDHAIIEATNGEEALERARDSRPDVVVMDVVMPEKNGYETCRELKRAPDIGDIPVVLISTKDSQTDRDWAVRQGADAYLSKPFTDHELTSIVARCVGDSGGT